MHCENHVAWTIVTRAMLAETGAEEDAIDEVVRAMQRLGDIRALALFKERVDGTTKISLRSRPPLDVAQFAQRWGGGGHSQASGANLAMPPDQAVADVIPLLQSMVAAARRDEQ